MTEQLNAPAIEEIVLELVQGLDGLIDDLTRGISPLDAFDEVRMILESLPLTTDEFCVASNRLKNAQRYVASSELGAACYELTMLSRSLADAGQNRVIRRGFRRMQLQSVESR